MAVTKRLYILATFVVSAVATVAFVLAMSTEQWVVSEASTDQQSSNSEIQYGLFKGTFVYGISATPRSFELHLTCVFSESRCAVTCKTTDEARTEEIKQLAQGLRPSPVCDNQVIGGNNTVYENDLISYAVYLFTILTLSVCVVCAVGCAGFSLANFTNNPVEPMCGVLGLYVYNVVGALTALLTLLLWGIHFAVDVQDSLAFSFVINGELQPEFAVFGYSYWMVLVGMLCHICNVILLETRRFLINRDPLPFTIPLDKNVDGNY